MLRRLKEIIGYDIISRNGEIGEVHDFLFDDYNWAVRYMIADTGDWLTDHKVLISPVSLGKADWDNKNFHVNLDKEQIERSPVLNENERYISRQYENDLAGYYGWPQYWSGDRGGYAGYSGDYTPSYIHSGTRYGGAAGTTGTGMQSEGMRQQDRRNQQQTMPFESNLRSIDDVTGFDIRTTDGTLGKVEDFLADDNNWMVRYMLVDTHKILPGGKHVLITPHWINQINWDDSEVEVNLTEAMVKNSPEVDVDRPITREYESRLFEHYSRPKYWER